MKKYVMILFLGLGILDSYSMAKNEINHDNNTISDEVLRVFIKRCLECAPNSSQEGCGNFKQEEDGICGFVELPGGTTIQSTREDNNIHLTTVVKYHFPEQLEKRTLGRLLAKSHYQKDQKLKRKFLVILEIMGFFKGTKEPSILKIDKNTTCFRCYSKGVPFLECKTFVPEHEFRKRFVEIDKVKKRFERLVEEHTQSPSESS